MGRPESPVCAETERVKKEPAVDEAEVEPAQLSIRGLHGNRRIYLPGKLN